MKPSQYIQKGWCQGVSARDHVRREVLALNPDATQWCLLGAINAAYPNAIARREAISGYLIDKIGHLRFAQWNDDPKRTQAEVIAMLQSIGE